MTDPELLKTILTEIGPVEHEKGYTLEIDSYGAIWRVDNNPPEPETILRENDVVASRILMIELMDLLAEKDDHFEMGYGEYGDKWWITVGDKRIYRRHLLAALWAAYQEVSK